MVETTTVSSIAPTVDYNLGIQTPTSIYFSGEEPYSTEDFKEILKKGKKKSPVIVVDDLLELVDNLECCKGPL